MCVYVYLYILVPNYLLARLGSLPTAIVVAFGIFLLVNVRASARAWPLGARPLGARSRANCRLHLRSPARALPRCTERSPRHQRARGCVRRSYLITGLAS